VGCRGSKTPEQVVRAWSEARNSGDDERAADLFATNAKIIAGDSVSFLRTHDQAVAFMKGSRVVWPNHQARQPRLGRNGQVFTRHPSSRELPRQGPRARIGVLPHPRRQDRRLRSDRRLIAHEAFCSR
jgi:hypothetical protein